MDRSTCTTEGLSLIEVLVALCVSLVLLLGVAPLWVALLQGGVGAQGLLVDTQRWRVAAARLERDVRMASADAPRALGCGPLLEATSDRVVLITRSVQAEGLEIVAWEVAGGSLMRRRASLPAAGVPSVPAAFQDNKTMMEGLESGLFTYRAGPGSFDGAVPAADLGRVDAVEIECRLTGTGRSAGVPVAAGAHLGR